jgi:hypothetical protein
MASTSVVLPWSTCAMMAMLRMLKLKVWFVLYLRIGYLRIGPTGVPNQPFSGQILWL